MKKNDSDSEFSLFGSPKPYKGSGFCKTYLVVIQKDSSGKSVIQHVCVEDLMKDIVPLPFDEVTLSNLQEKGVEPHSLDMIDTSRIGIDADIDAFANSVVQNSSAYVKSSNPE